MISHITLWCDFLLAASENTCICDDGMVAMGEPLTLQCLTDRSDPAVIN